MQSQAERRNSGSCETANTTLPDCASDRIAKETLSMFSLSKSLVGSSKK